MTSAETPIGIYRQSMSTDSWEEDENMLERLAKYLSECPHFDGVRVRVNYLDGKPLSAALKMKSASPVVKRYADGGLVCESRFVLEVRQTYCGAETENVAAAKRCEDIEEWIRVQDDKGNLPEIGGGRTPFSLEIVRNFEITHIGNVDAKFEAELGLVYYKK